jgi:hypothetical protein
MSFLSYPPGNQRGDRLWQPLFAKDWPAAEQRESGPAAATARRKHLHPVTVLRI